MKLICLIAAQASIMAGMELRTDSNCSWDIVAVFDLRRLLRDLRGRRFPAAIFE